MAVLYDAWGNGGGRRPPQRLPQEEEEDRLRKLAEDGQEPRSDFGAGGNIAPQAPQAAPAPTAGGGAATGGAPAPTVQPYNREVMDRYGWSEADVDMSRGTFAQETDVSGIAPGYDTPQPMGTTPATTQIVSPGAGIDMSGLAPGFDTPQPQPSAPPGGLTQDDIDELFLNPPGEYRLPRTEMPNIPSNQEDVLAWMREGIENPSEFDSVMPGELNLPGFEGIAPGDLNLPGFESVLPGDLNLPGYESVLPGEINAPEFESVLPGDLTMPEFEGVDPRMSEDLTGLGDKLLGYTEDWLDTPSRYDTDLFGQLWDSGLANLDTEQDRRMQEILEGSNRRLGPASGQLTNQYIDLEDQYDQRRNDLLAGLAREQALTYSQDRESAFGAGSGLTEDMYGREQGLRDEQRTERGAEYDRFLDEQALQRGFREERRGERGTEFDRFLDVEDLESRRRNEIRDEYEREFGRAITGEELEARMRDERRGEQDREFDRALTREDLEASRRDELRGERGEEYGRALDREDLETQRRDEARGERETEYGRERDRLADIRDFGDYDRQLGRDAMDDYFRQTAADQGWTDLELRNVQQNHSMWMDVAEMYRDWPSYLGGDPNAPGDGGVTPPWSGGEAFPDNPEVIDDAFFMDPDEFADEYGFSQDEVKQYWGGFMGDLFDMTPEEFEDSYGMPHDEAMDKYQDFLKSGEDPMGLTDNGPGGGGGRGGGFRDAYEDAVNKL